jgi:post-segregation antitoxin (ccd killing protein)
VKTTVADVAKRLVDDPAKTMRTDSAEVELVDELATEFAELELELVETMTVDLSKALDKIRHCRWNCLPN